jgi:hypothetical protein
MVEDFVVESLNEIVEKRMVVEDSIAEKLNEIVEKMVEDSIAEKLDVMNEVVVVDVDSLLMMMEEFDEKNFVKNLVKIDQHFVKVVT